MMSVPAALWMHKPVEAGRQLLTESLLLSVAARPIGFLLVRAIQSASYLRRHYSVGFNLTFRRECIPVYAQYPTSAGLLLGYPGVESEAH